MVGRRRGGEAAGRRTSALLCGVFLSPGKPRESQAARAIRTAALGTSRDASTCRLSTELSPPALQGAQGSRENSSWGALPT